MTSEKELKLPSGFRFKPTDVELLDYYLRRKVHNIPLPPTKFREVQFYNYNPETLTAISDNKSSNGAVDEWYFFTPRDRKYKNGKRPARAAGDGYWKATGADRPIPQIGKPLGSKKTLVFYKGRPPKGYKTNWILHEFVLNDAPTRERNGDEDMRLDDWVLCRLYKKRNSKSDPETGNDEEEEEEAADANIPDKTETFVEEYQGIPPPQSEQFQATDFNAVPQQTLPMPSYNAYDASACGGLPQFPERYDAYDASAYGGLNCYACDASASGGLPQLPERYDASAYGGLNCYACDASASGGLPLFPDDSAYGGFPQFPDDSAFVGLPQFPDDSASGGLLQFPELPQFPEQYNAYDSAFGGLQQLPEAYYDPTIIPGQAVSDYGNFIPTVTPISSIPPAAISSMPPDQFNWIHQQQPEQQFPSTANNFQFSAADQFLLNVDIGLPQNGDFW